MITDSTTGQPPAPVTIRDHRLGDILGVGATAVVYRATHLETGQQVAVKVLTHHLPDADIPNNRSEAVTLSGLRHPGLVEIYETGIADHRPYLVMRLIDGESLARRIARGPLTVTDVSRLGVRLADTLAYIHERGVVHRDIKPSNVLLDDLQHAYLADFGNSKLIDATRITATGMTAGTPAFMAPEQVRGHDVGPAADVYALGLVLLEALTGRREYTGGVVEAAVARLYRDPAVPTGIPVNLHTALLAMTRQEPGHRPSARNIARHLAAPGGMEALDGTALAMPRRPGTGPGAIPRLRRRVRVTAMVAVAIAITIAAAPVATRAPIAASDPPVAPVPPTTSQTRPTARGLPASPATQPAPPVAEAGAKPAPAPPRAAPVQPPHDPAPLITVEADSVADSDTAAVTSVASPTTQSGGNGEQQHKKEKDAQKNGKGGHTGDG